MNDIVVAKEVQRAVEEATGTILNRNHKTAALGLGTWEDCQEWLLRCLQAVQAAQQAKVIEATQLFSTLLLAAFGSGSFTHGLTATSPFSISPFPKPGT